MNKALAILCLLALWACLSARAAFTVFEAENATVSGPSILADYAGYTGSGYADFNNASGDYIEFALNANSAGNYPISFRFANGSAGDRPLQLNVNGATVVGSLSFPVTGSWANWAYTATNSVTFNAGLNTVRITATGSSGANVDHLLVTVGGTSAATNIVSGSTNSTAVPMRRPISPSQPMWLVHIDTWNYPDPQKIIDLIPPDIRPYVVMNISLSISHDTNTPPRFQVAEYGYEIAKSWLRVCAENRMWAMVQQSSGGMHQFSDFDLTVYEEFFREYPNFIGFNYAEQFWGFDSPTDPVSAVWTDRINHFADLLALSHKYGGYLVVSWCGNQFDPNINPIAMLKRNATFAAACRNYNENYILEEKYTQQSYQSDMESVCLGAYLSGYAGQYGIRYDSTGWTDSTGTNQNFTLASGGAPHLEHIMLTGESVIDAPELIWQQCFQEIGAGATDNGYTMRRWQTFPQFNNVSVDIFRKILDGTVRIPSRQEVINRTKYVIIADVNSGTADTVYSSPDTLFEGLYRMEGDGNLRDNKTFFKKTGRYPTIPTVYQLDDTNAYSFQFKVNKSAYATRWPTIAAKTNEMNTNFPSEYAGDLYAGRLENGWVTYNPYKSNLVASASIPFKYNTCDRVDLTYSRYTSGVMKEFSNNVTFYLCNYQSDLDNTLKTDTIAIYGSTNTPSWSYAERGSHQASIVTSNWSGGVFSLTVQHNGALDITVKCAGTNTGRLTNYTTATLVAPDQPMIFPGPRQYEAECFDYKNIGGITSAGYPGSIRNYSGQGYLNFGTSAAAAVRDAVTVLKSGTYKLQTKYAVTGANISTIDLYVNGAKVATPTFTATATLSNWATFKTNITLNVGTNSIEFKANATAASALYFDNMVITPTAYGDGIVIQENTPGFNSVDGSIENLYSGYTGDGYANTADTNGASIYWNLNFDASITKAITFRYSFADGSTNNRTADLIVNGTNVASKIQFPPTSSWTNWDYVTVYPNIPAGAATVRLQSTSTNGLPNIDSLEIIGGWAGEQPPTGLNAVAVSASQINLTWIAASTATSYNIKRSMNNGGPYAVIASGVTATNYSDTGLAGGATYYYVVSAVSALGEGSDSAPAFATTPAPILLPLADSYVESSTATSNYGTATNMLVKNNVTLATRNAYLLFNVTGLAGVSSATLTLMPNRVDDTTVKLYYGLAPTNWSETNITWNTQPASSGIFFATNTVAAFVPMVLDVTSQVASQATNGGLLSIRITQPTNSLNGLIQFCSKEHPTNSWRPLLQYVIPANSAPSLVAITNRVIGAGVTLNITNIATDSDVPAQTLTFSLLAAPTNAVINSNSGVLTWRPLVTQAGTSNPFTVRVTDSGAPVLSATQSFTVIVTNLPRPVILNPYQTAGRLVLQVTGATGPDYQIQSSTNLIKWAAVLTTNSPVLPFTWTNNNFSLPVNFYRIIAGPPF